MLGIPELTVIGGSWNIETLVKAEGLSVPSYIEAVLTSGYYVSGDGGGALYKRAGVEPSHYGKFQSADGAWWEIGESLVTPLQFGAYGDGVTDDTDYLNRWGNYRGASKHIPARVFSVSGVVDLVGEITDPLDTFYLNLTCDAGAEIVQASDNMAVCTVYGARGSFDFPTISYANVQLNTYLNSVGLLVAPYPGAGGFYMNTVKAARFKRDCGIGFFNPAVINSTLASGAVAGTTSLSVSNAQTAITGSYPWTPGMWVQVYLASGAWEIVKIANVSGSTLTLKTPLVGAANAGARVVFSTNKLVGASDTGTPPKFFSNTWELFLAESPTRYGWVDTGGGTDNFVANRYIRGSTGADISSPPDTCISAIYEIARDGDAFGITNIENINCTADAWVHTGTCASAAYTHIEGVRLKTDASALISGTIRNFDFGTVEVQYCTILASDLATSGGIFKPGASSATFYGNNKGFWNVSTLATKKNIFGPTAFLVRDGSSNLTTMSILNWQWTRDSGLYPRTTLVYPNNYAANTSIKNMVPSGAIGYGLSLDMSVLTVAPVYTNNLGKFKVSSIAVSNPSVSMTTATSGVFADAGAATLVSNVNNNSLASLTDTNKVTTFALAATEDNKLYNKGSTLYYKNAAAQPLPAVVVNSVSSYLTGRNGGENNTNLGFVNFSVAHGLVVGSKVTITGSVTAALNSTFRIIDVPSTTQITVYVDSAVAVGTSSAPIADVGISVQLIPTVDVTLYGQSYQS